VHLLLPINAGAARNSQGFCKTLFSALVHGYEPTVINWDVERDWEFMQRMKVTGTYEYLTNITDQNADADLVLMVDALDVWFQLSPRTLVERFEELGTSGVVIGAETICFPNEGDSFACQGVPESTLPKGAYSGGWEPRWANSGTVIGSVAAMRTLYKDLFIAFQDPAMEDQGDQGIFNEYLAARRLSADYRSRLFWSTAFADPDRTARFINTPYHIDNLIPHELYPPLLYHAQTGEIPVVIHINGPHKQLIEEWWGKLWWNKLQDEDARFRDIVSSRLKGAVRLAGSGLKEWANICPEEVKDWHLSI
jgi:hypothetical protein